MKLWSNLDYYQQHVPCVKFQLDRSTQILELEQFEFFKYTYIRTYSLNINFDVSKHSKYAFTKPTKKCSHWNKSSSMRKQ